MACRYTYLRRKGYQVELLWEHEFRQEATAISTMILAKWKKDSSSMECEQVAGEALLIVPLPLPPLRGFSGRGNGPARNLLGCAPEVASLSFDDSGYLHAHSTQADATRTGMREGSGGNTSNG
jgi:hypothetical protein